MVKQGSNILLAFFILWAVVCSTPLLGKSQYFAVLLAMSLLFMVLFLNTVRRQRVMLLSVASYIVLIFIYKIIGYSSAEWGNYMNQLTFFIPILLMLLIPEKMSVRQGRALWWVMALIMVFNIADNIILSILYPQLNSVSRFYQDEEFLASINAGGTSFYTFSLFFFNVCFLVFLNCKMKLPRLIALAMAIISSVYILGYCLKGSVVVYYLLSLVLQFFAYKTNNTTVFFIVLAFGGIMAFLVLELFRDAIVDFIISVSPDQRLTTRLITLVDVENEEANISTVTGRTSLYLLSVDTWLSSLTNFVFGIGDHRAAFGAKAIGIGQHSDLLDTLARYGLLGLIIVFLVFKSFIKYIITLFDDNYKLQLTAIFFILIMCGFTKGIFDPAIGCVIFLLLPLASRLVNKKTCG